MTVISRKVSVFGDSTSIAQQGGLDRAARIYAYNSAKFGNSGYNNCSMGGLTLSDNYNLHVYNDSVQQPSAFPSYIANSDDGDIIVVILGANDPVVGANGVLVDGSAPNAAAYIGSDNLYIGALYLQHVQQIRAAGKRPVLVGMPYYDPDRALSPGGIYDGEPAEKARALSVRLAANNSAMRCVAGLQNVPFIATFGYGGAGGHPTADYNSTYDGVHPTKAYSEAVSDYIAAQLIGFFSL